MANFIPDGFSTAGYIKGTQHRDPVRFTYRPAVSQEKAAISRAIVNTADPLKEESLAAVFVAKHVSDWDVKKPDGSDVAITPENALRLHPALANRLFNIVMGMDEPDVDPNNPDVESATESVGAAISGQAVADSLAKN